MCTTRGERKLIRILCQKKECLELRNEFNFLECLWNHIHTGKCIRRFGGIYAYCRYFID